MLIFIAFITVTAQATAANIAYKEMTPVSSPLKTELFNLADKTGDAYGTKEAESVRRALNQLLQNAEGDGTALREKLLSGPEPQGILLEANGEQTWFYQACQQHACSTTNLALLYNPERVHMIGRLVEHCQIRWLGNPASAEKNLIEQATSSDRSPQNGCPGGTP